MHRQSIEEIAPGGVHSKVFDIVSNLPGRHILDAPAGYGALTNRLLSAGKIVTAGDIDMEKIKTRENPGLLHLLRLDLNQRIPLEDGHFDIAVCLEGIEHIENQWNLIRNFHRILKPGGYLVLSTPNIVNFRSRIRYFMEGRYEHFKRPLVVGKSTQHDLENGHIAPVSYFELQFILESCGFSIQELHTNRYSSKNLVSVILKPIFRLIYLHKNRRDANRNRGSFRELYRTILSDEVYYGETLIVLAQKPARKSC